MEIFAHHCDRSDPSLECWRDADHDDDAASHRGRRVVLLLAMIWVVGIFDLSFTLIAYRLGGGFREVNPLARAILDFGGLLVAFKLTALLLGTAIFITYRKRLITELAAWGICAINIVLAVVWLVYYTRLADD